MNDHLKTTNLTKSKLAGRMPRFKWPDASEYARMQMAAAISAPLGKAFAYITDLSELGMRVTMAKDLQVKTGDEVSIYTREMGFIHGEVTWQKSKTLGVKIHTSTNTYAQTLSAVREAQAERRKQLL